MVNDQLFQTIRKASLEVAAGGCSKIVIDNVKVYRVGIIIRIDIPEKTFYLGEQITTGEGETFGNIT